MNLSDAGSWASIVSLVLTALTLWLVGTLRSRLIKSHQSRTVLAQLGKLISEAKSQRELGKDFHSRLTNCLENVETYLVEFSDRKTQSHIKKIREFATIDESNRGVVAEHLNHIKIRNKKWGELQ